MRECLHLVTCKSLVILLSAFFDPIIYGIISLYFHERKLFHIIFLLKMSYLFYDFFRNLIYYRNLHQVGEEIFGVWNSLRLGKLIVSSSFCRIDLVPVKVGLDYNFARLTFLHFEVSRELVIQCVLSCYSVLSNTHSTAVQPPALFENILHLVLLLCINLLGRVKT